MENDGAPIAVAVALAVGASAGPVGGVPWPVAVLETEPACMSASVMTCDAVHWSTSPGASVVGGVTALPFFVHGDVIVLPLLNIGSVMPALVSVTLPVLVAVSV